MPDKTAAEALSLDKIIQFELPALLRRQHLNRDIVVCIVGDRGDGKSIDAATISTLDYMIQGEPCHANMRVKSSFEIDDQTAGKYGMKGGVATFEAQPLNISKLLYTSYYDDAHGVFLIDEVNIDLADARRSMSNQNLAASDVAQQLRKSQSALVCTCIHEMFLEIRIRDIVDIYIVTKDTALTPEGLANKQKPGLEFEWEIFPMTRKLTGETYSKTGKTITATFNGGNWWGVIDTWERQRRTKHSVSDTAEIYAGIEIAEKPEITQHKRDWGWLYEAIKNLHDQGIAEIHNEDMKEYLKIEERGIAPNILGVKLSELGVKRSHSTLTGFYYLIDNFDLKKGISLPQEKEEKEKLLV